MREHREEIKKEYKVSYCLGDMYHAYVVEAFNEASAIQKVLNQLMTEDIKEIFHDFKIERNYFFGN